MVTPVPKSSSSGANQPTPANQESPDLILKNKTNQEAQSTFDKNQLSEVTSLRINSKKIDNLTIESNDEFKQLSTENNQDESLPVKFLPSNAEGLQKSSSSIQENEEIQNPSKDSSLKNLSTRIRGLTKTDFFKSKPSLNPIPPSLNLIPAIESPFKEIHQNTIAQPKKVDLVTQEKEAKDTANIQKEIAETEKTFLNSTVIYLTNYTEVLSHHPEDPDLQSLVGNLNNNIKFFYNIDTKINEIVNNTALNVHEKNIKLSELYQSLDFKSYYDGLTSMIEMSEKKTLEKHYTEGKQISETNKQRLEDKIIFAQRMPRHESLLRELVKYESNDSASTQLQNALKKVESYNTASDKYIDDVMSKRGF